MVTNTHAPEYIYPISIGELILYYILFWFFELQYALLFPQIHTITHKREINLYESEQNIINIDISSIGEESLPSYYLSN